MSTNREGPNMGSREMDPKLKEILDRHRPKEGTPVPAAEVKNEPPAPKLKTLEEMFGKAKAARMRGEARGFGKQVKDD